jgi:hypothetical protein
VVYGPITHRAVEAIRGGELDDPEWAERLTLRFGQRYLDALAAELAGEPQRGWEWERYYALEANPEVSALRVAAMGVAVHLVVDLPHALVEVDTSDSHRDDFVRFGAVLVDGRSELVADLAELYGVDAEALFGGFFLGDWIDGTFGEGVTSTFAFQAIRTKAWRNRWLLDSGWGLIARGEIDASLRTIDGALATLDALDGEPSRAR